MKRTPRGELGNSIDLNGRRLLNSLICTSNKTYLKDNPKDCTEKSDWPCKKAKHNYPKNCIDWIRSHFI